MNRSRQDRRSPPRSNTQQPEQEPEARPEDDRQVVEGRSPPRQLSEGELLQRYEN